jgi:hypothetical protein
MTCLDRAIFSLLILFQNELVIAKYMEVINKQHTSPEGLGTAA